MSVERFENVLVRGYVWRKPDPDGFTEINVAPEGRGPVDVLLPPERFTTEATLRADERAKVEAEIVAWLRSHPILRSAAGTAVFARGSQIDEYAKAVERGEHRGR